MRPAYDEQLPWLEAVDDEDVAAGISGKRMGAALAVILLAVALVAGTFFWLGRRDAAATGGAPELIRAEPGPYKTRPSDPGGLDVAGESETAFQTSAGEDHDSQLDLSGLPGQPAAAAPAQPKVSEGVPKPSEPAAEEEPAEPAVSGAAGSVIQLGAYRNQAQAERAWTSLSSRFPDVAALTKMVVPYSGGYRLRAGAGSSAQARQACQALRTAGENCFVAN